jgi:hypothetical protein
LPRRHAANVAAEVNSNRCASPALAGGLAALILLLPATVVGQDAPRAEDPSRSRASSTMLFLAGAAAAFGAHEAGHLTADLLFDAGPRLKAVDFHGIPFFAITHRADVSPRQRVVIASAGFWVQHAGSEIIVSRRPRLRTEHASFRKGVLAFNVLASAAYAGAAFARTGPDERDTRGMAEGSGIDERWIGAMILAPAVLDSIRYLDPDAKWAVWTSRAAKVGLVLLVLR